LPVVVLVLLYLEEVVLVDIEQGQLQSEHIQYLQLFKLVLALQVQQ
jgi:hypothetical protein